MEIENLEMPVKSVPDKAVVSVKTASKPQKSTIDNGKDSDSSDAVDRNLLELEKGKNCQRIHLILHLLA